MKRRCLSVKDEFYKDYGGRGIVICRQWLNSFENFLADMGLCPVGYTLERKDNDGNYKPGNCVWATRKANQANKRNSLNIAFKGRRQTLKEWADELGLQYQLLRYRICIAKWAIAEAFTKRPNRKAAA